MGIARHPRSHYVRDVVQKLARLMTLTVDPNAPTKLSPELSKQVANSKRVVQLSRESKALTKKLGRKYGFVRHAPPNDPLLLAKTQVNAALHREKNNRRNRMLEKARKRHFRNAEDQKDRFPLVCKPTQCIFCPRQYRQVLPGTDI